jgi:biotin carboxylase
MVKIKKIMVLGASSCQIPIMLEARSMGLEVITASVAGEYPGFNVADKAYIVDVRDKEKILSIAKEEKIDGIITDQTDIPVKSVAYVAEKMGLPGIGYECANWFTDKFQMRKKCDSLGIPVPKYLKAKTFKEAFQAIEYIGFPAILKPVDSQGSRGVKKVENILQLERAFQDALWYSASKNVIVEEYFQGHEVVIQGFIADGKFTNLSIGDRKYFNFDRLFIPSRTLFPSVIKKEQRQNLLRINEKLIKSINPSFGITHSEYLVDTETGQFKLVETAIRGGGVYISSDLVPMASGININRLLLKNVIGIRTDDINLKEIRNKASAYICFYLPTGIVMKIHGLKRLKKIKGIKKINFENIKVGEKIDKIIDKTMRLGPILIAGENRTELNYIIEKIENTLIILVKTPTGKIGKIIW